MIKIERRLEQPRWLDVAVPLGSIVVAFARDGCRAARSPGTTRSTPTGGCSTPPSSAARRWTATLTSATPLLFTGLAAATAFRMNLFNIGAEGQLYLGAICALGIAIWLGPRHATAVDDLRDVRLRRGRRRALGADPRRR